MHRAIGPQRLKYRLAAMAGALGLMVGGAAAASSVTHYFYDSAGRFIGLTTNPTNLKSENYDAADNRTAWFASGFVKLTSNQQLANYQVLTQGDALVSGDGRFTCAFQEDGNVVIYQGSNPLWSTKTSLTNAAWLDMMADGNLILFDIQGNNLWQTNTGGGGVNAGASVVMQSDGNLVIYATNGKALWASGTGGH